MNGDSFSHPFDDEELAATARQVQAMLESPSVDAEFRRRLRAQVVAERARLINSRQAPVRRRRRPWWRRMMEPSRLGPMRTLTPALAVLLIACGVFAGFTVLPRLGRPAAATVAMTGGIESHFEGGASPALVVHFSRPVNRATVSTALDIYPATSFHVGWRGQELVLTPMHGFAPNVPYVLTVDGARARTEGGANLAGSPELSFGTAPTVSTDRDLGPAGQTAAAFAAAQLANDVASMRSEAAPGLSLPALPSLSRIWVVSVTEVSADTSRADVELLIDAGPGHPDAVIATETLLIRPDAYGRLAVAGISVSGFKDMGDGPRIMHVGVGPGHTMLVTYDCDMDAASVAGSNVVTDADGQVVPISTSYDAATRTVTVRLPAWVRGTVTLRVTRGLRSVDGQRLAEPFQTTLQVA